MAAQLTFPVWRAWTAGLPGHVSAALFSHLLEDDQRACWDDLLARVRLLDESELLYERRLREPYVPRRERNSQARGTASKSSRSTRVVFDGWGDPLHAIPAREYVQAIAGVEVSSSGRLCCPLPDHADRTPSFVVYPDGWHCFGCGRGGDIYSFGAAVYGLDLRGRDFIELRRRIAAALLGGPRV